MMGEISHAVRAYLSGGGDIFSLGDNTYRYTAGYYMLMEITGYDAIGYSYHDTGILLTTEQVDELYEQELHFEQYEKELKIMESRLELTEYQKGLKDKFVAEETYFNNGKTTVAIVTMKNGFDVVGTSACVDRKDYDIAIGRLFAMQDALSKIDAFAGYARQQEAFEIEQYVQEQKELEREQENMVKEWHASVGVSPLLFGSSKFAQETDYLLTIDSNGIRVQKNPNKKEEKLCTEPVSEESIFGNVKEVLVDGEDLFKMMTPQEFGGYKTVDLNNTDIIRMNGDASCFVDNGEGICFPKFVNKDVEVTEPKVEDGLLQSLEYTEPKGYVSGGFIKKGQMEMFNENHTETIIPVKDYKKTEYELIMESLRKMVKKQVQSGQSAW